MRLVSLYASKINAVELIINERDVKINQIFEIFTQ